MLSNTFFIKDSWQKSKSKASSRNRRGSFIKNNWLFELFLHFVAQWVLIIVNLSFSMSQKNALWNLNGLLDKFNLESLIGVATQEIDTFLALITQGKVKSHTDHILNDKIKLAIFATFETSGRPLKMSISLHINILRIKQILTSYWIVFVKTRTFNIKVYTTSFEIKNMLHKPIEEIISFLSRYS